MECGSTESLAFADGDPANGVDESAHEAVRKEIGRAADLPDSDVSVERTDLNDALAVQVETPRQIDSLGVRRSGRERFPSRRLREALQESSPLSYATQFDWNRRMFQVVGIRSKEKTHSARKQSVRHAELGGVAESQIRRAGRWNTDAMTGVYLSYLPRAFMRSIAGFPQRERVFPPARAGDTRGGPLWADLARHRRLAGAYGSLSPRPNRQRGRTTRSRRFGIPAPPPCAPRDPAAGFRRPTLERPQVFMAMLSESRESKMTRSHGV